jgi:CBS domain containing-hemolysin-like protein
VLSPVLLDELHQSGHSRFPVYAEGGKETVVGLLYIRDLIELKAHTVVSEVMQKHVYFVHEDRELDHVLNAFIRTKHHLFIVVNAFAEITGVVTIEDVLEQIIGKPIVDEFDRYDDMREVAKQQARQVTKQLQDDQKVVE